MKKIKKICLNVLLSLYPYITHCSSNNDDFKDIFYDFDIPIDMYDCPCNTTKTDTQIKNLQEKNETLQKELEIKNAQCAFISNALYETKNLILLKSAAFDENEVQAKFANIKSQMHKSEVVSSMTLKAYELGVAEIHNNMNLSNSATYFQTHASVEYIKNHNTFLRNAFDEMKTLIILQSKLLQEHEIRATQAATASRIIVSKLNLQTDSTAFRSSSSLNSNLNSHINASHKRKRAHSSQSSLHVESNTTCPPIQELAQPTTNNNSSSSKLIPLSKNLS